MSEDVAVAWFVATLALCAIGERVAQAIWRRVSAGEADR